MMINIDTVGLVVNEMRERIKETVVFPVLGIMNHILGVDKMCLRFAPAGSRPLFIHVRDICHSICIASPDPSMRYAYQKRIVIHP
jgi:hypothetical protein